MAGIHIIARAKSIRIEYNEVSRSDKINDTFEFYQPPFHVEALKDSMGVKIATAFGGFDIDAETLMAIEKVVYLDGQESDLNQGITASNTQLEIVQIRANNLVNYLNDVCDLIG